MIPFSQFVDGVVDWAVNDVVALMPNNPSKFLALVAVSSAKSRPEVLIGAYRPIMVQLGVMTEDFSQVDETALKSAVSEAFSSMPSVTWAGFTFTSADSEKLFKRLGV